MIRATAAILLALACYAQSSDSQLTFEVASIKPAPPPEMGRMVFGTRGGPGTGDPTRFTCNNCSLFQLITMAYNIRPYQLSGGPNWLGSERFEVTAKIPAGATKEQFRVMLQNLLAERFKLVVHQEKKDLPMFELVVGKGGPKMKESPDQADTVPDAGGPPPPPPGPMRIEMGRDGMPVMPGGAPGRTMMMMMPGRARLMAVKETMDALAGRLSMSAGRPVTDATGLKKKYDFTLTFAPESMSMGPGGPMGGGMGGGGAMVMTMQVGGPGPGGGGPGGPAAGGDHGSDGEPAPALGAALQEQLGLKLEAKKGPVDIIVVDKVEKTPTEN